MDVIIVILFILLIVIYCDAALLKAKDRPRFIEIFSVSPIKIAVGAMLIILVTVLSTDRSADLPPFILLLFLPIYILKRQQFMEQIKRSAAGPSPILSDALGVIMMWIYGVMVFGFLMTAVIGLYPDIISQMGDLVISAGFSSILILFLVYRASANFSDRGFLTNVRMRKGDRSWFEVAMLPSILGILFALFSSYLTVARKIQPQTPLNEILETTQSFSLILLFLFLAICLAPLVEEVVFRGYFFHVCKVWIGQRKTIYVIALSFALLHVGQYWGDWMAIVMVTLLGFTLTMLRAWTDSTLACAITHYVYNASVTIIPVIMIALTNPPYYEYKLYYPYHDTETKVALLREAIDIEPDLADAYNDLAWLYAEEEKNLHLALSLVDQALKFSPEQPAYLDTKAVVLEKLGRTEDAQAVRDLLQLK